MIRLRNGPGWLRIPDPAAVALVLFGASLLVALAAGLRLAAIEERQLVASVAVSDSFRALVPAENLLAGKGYGLDGRHRSYSGSPLWSLAGLAVAALSSDPVVSLRILVFVSFLFWAGAAVVLFDLLRREQPLSGAIAATGFLWCGLLEGRATLGLENGLAAFLFALVLRFRAREEEREATPPGVFPVSGWAAAAFSLLRFEYLLLPLILALAAARRREPGEERRRAAWSLLTPTLLAFSAQAIGSLVLFGRLFPLPDSVRLLLEEAWGAPEGGLAKTMAVEAGRLVLSALSPLLPLFPEVVFAAALLPVGVAVLALAIVGSARVASGLARRGSPTDRTGVAPFLLFGALHLVALLALYPHFVRHGRWFFPAEFLLAWLGLALVAGRIGRRLRPGAIGLVVAAGLVIGLDLHARRQVARRYLFDGGSLAATIRAGRWIDRALPAGSRVGSLDAAPLAFAAPNMSVSGLDGSLGDEVLFRDFFSQLGMHEWIYGERIDWLVDWNTLENLRHGFAWQGRIPVERLELVRWWPFEAGSDLASSRAVALFRVRPRDGSPFPAPHRVDRLSQIQFDAAVLGRWPIARDDELDPASVSARGERVATSFVVPGLGLHHVLMGEAELAAAAIRPDNVEIERPFSAPMLAGALELLGATLPAGPVRSGTIVPAALVWLVRAPVPAGRWAVELWLDGPEEATLLAVSRGRHATSPIEGWTPGELVAETAGLPIPPGFPQGSWPLRVALRDLDSPGRPTSDEVFLGNLAVTGW